MNLLGLDDPGRKVLFMGNEAMARGALEAGVRVAAAYPGNPSSEIIGSLAKVAKDPNLYVEWSVNEKVALEVAAGASLSGLKSLAAMKHNGLNVAVDFLANLAPSGTRAGMVIIVCDDPHALSSSNEQDTRAYAKMLDLPLLEPNGFQQGKEMVKFAFELSEQVGIPVMVRSVTRFSHARGVVSLGPLPEAAAVPHFDTTDRSFPNPAETTHPRLHQKLAKAAGIMAESGFNTCQGPEKPELLAVTTGSGAAYLEEALDLLGAGGRVGLLKLGTSWPLPKELLLKHLAASGKILVFEELDPFVEDNLKALYADHVERLGVKRFSGKADGTTPAFGENSTDIAVEALAKALGLEPSPPRSEEYAARAAAAVAELTTGRELGFCAGCPHRATYWAIKNSRAMDGREVVVLGDIGCYAQGRKSSGYEQMMTFHAMGSGAGLANGMGQLPRFGAKQPVLAVCGDSTFFHAAMPALVNARYNKADLLMLVLDNSATAMTGFQPHPGVGRNAMGEPAPKVDVAAVCRSLGAKVKELDPFDLAAARDEILGCLENPDGIKILVMRQECALVRAKRGSRLYSMELSAEKCLGQDCGCNRYCTRVFKCPGLFWDAKRGHAAIDEAICAGCGVCADICPAGAITKEAS